MVKMVIMLAFKHARDTNQKVWLSLVPGKLLNLNVNSETMVNSLIHSISSYHKCILKIAGISDSEIYYYRLNFKESVATNWLTRLPSKPKNGAKFRFVV